MNLFDLSLTSLTGQVNINYHVDCAGSKVTNENLKGNSDFKSLLINFQGVGASTKKPSMGGVYFLSRKTLLIWQHLEAKTVYEGFQTPFQNINFTKCDLHLVTIPSTQTMFPMK